MIENTGLERFLEAQERTYAVALQEIRNGYKESHWMWFIFPQIAGLGMSYMAEYYAIRNLEEARNYLHHPVLGQRLVEISEALLELETYDPIEVFGPIDAMKLRSCMTLFEMVNDGDSPVFRLVLEKYSTSSSCFSRCSRKTGDKSQ